MIAARTAIVTSALALIMLAALHALSPEFDPSWRVVSEYADGRYGSVLSLMFLFWAVSSWALAFGLRPYVSSVAGRIGVGLLIVAGAGTAMAAFFDINQPLHGLAGLLGIGVLPIAALLLSYAVPRERTAAPNTGVLVWAAHATWITVVMLVAGLITLFVTYVHSGGAIPPDGRPLPLGTVLPHGTIALVGYANRLLIAAYCFWNILAGSWIASRGRRESLALA
jgi:Protein of unknown function (DUF998)